jgi:hypothetical protein
VTGWAEGRRTYIKNMENIIPKIPYDIASPSSSVDAAIRTRIIKI